MTRIDLRFGTFRSVAAAVLGVVAFACACEAAPARLQLIQLGMPGQGGTSYGYQPYNDRNPTGFYHPGGMGFGHYYLTQKYHGHRFRSFSYRKFRGT